MLSYNFLLINESKKNIINIFTKYIASYIKNKIHNIIFIDYYI